MRELNFLERRFISKLDSLRWQRSCSPTRAAERSRSRILDDGGKSENDPAAPATGLLLLAAMAHIVHLTNLSDDAEAVDVRRFFDGLDIPSGNVHILGGDNGDVYVGFATQAAAEAALLRHGQMLCGSLGGFS